MYPKAKFILGRQGYLLCDEQDLETADETFAGKSDNIERSDYPRIDGWVRTIADGNATV